MRFISTALLTAPAISALSLPQREVENQKRAEVNVAQATFDGSCYYPAPGPNFDLNAYLGKWYQVAGTPFFATIGSKCITAEYSANVSYPS